MADEKVVQGFNIDDVKNFFSEELLAQLQELGKGVVISAADAGLVYLGDNIDKVDFGSATPAFVGVVKIATRELRNLLHGTRVSSEVVLESVPVNPEVIKK